MKVLFLTHPRSGLFRGGMEIQIDKTAQALKSLGVEVVFYSPWEDCLDRVDLCHVFSPDSSIYMYVTRALEKGKAVVVSPVFNCFAEPSWKMRLKVKLSQIRGILPDLRLANSLIGKSHKVLALNSEERDALIKIFDFNPKNCLIVPNGINKSCLNALPDIFTEKYNVKDFVLEVASIEKRKNQLTLIKAMRDLPYPLVLVGRAVLENGDYIKQCKAAAGDNVIFTGKFDFNDPLLPSVFAAAKLFVLPSYTEVMPLTLYEAAVAGSRVIASKNFPIAKEVAEFIPRFNPDDVDGLAKLIKSEMQLSVDEGLLSAAREMPSWDDVGKQILGIYEEALSEVSSNDKK